MNDTVTSKEIESEKNLLKIASVMDKKNINMMEACKDLKLNPEVMRDYFWNRRSMRKYRERLRSDYLSQSVAEMNAMIEKERDIEKAWLKCTVMIWAAEKRISTQMIGA